MNVKGVRIYQDKPFFKGCTNTNTNNSTSSSTNNCNNINVNTNTNTNTNSLKDQMKLIVHHIKIDMVHLCVVNIIK